MLAGHLGGRSIDEWKSVLTPQEVAAWIEFYRQSPFDDYHRYYRPAALVAHAIGGAEVDAMLGWLERRPVVQYSDAALNSMRAFGLKPPIGRT